MATKADLTLSKLVFKSLLKFSEKATKEEIIEALKEHIRDLEREDD